MPVEFCFSILMKPPRRLWPAAESAFVLSGFPVLGVAELGVDGQ
jgi:hypothetical protein